MRGGVARGLTRGSILLGLALLVAVDGGASHAKAQTAPGPGKARSNVSPVAPGDLTRPAFDTVTHPDVAIPTPEIAAATVVAEVEGTPITLGDVRDAMAALPPATNRFSFEELYPGVLEKLIKEQALVVRARQKSADQDAEFRRRAKALVDRELAESFMRQEIARQVTEAMMLDRYRRDYAGKPGPEELRARIIQTTTEAKAKEAITRLHAGEDFATVARQISQGTAADAGGDLGFVERDNLIPEIAGVLNGLSPGQFAPIPVRAAGGWMVLKLEERRDRPAPSFAEVRDQIQLALMKEAVGPFAEQAMDGLTIRRYGFAGAARRPADGGK